MTEQERASFLRNVNRAAGKRQIKPTQHFFDALVGGSDESDHDFAPDEASDQELGSNSEGEEGSDDSEAGSDDENGSNSNMADADDDADVDHNGPRKPTEKGADLCCICLGPASDCNYLSKCDRCHVIVHENCYGVLDDELDSCGSSTEVPWFCDPCMFGLIEPPHCEVCPSRYGAFKKTDVGNGYVHVLCSQYIPQITYADGEKKIAVSYQELDYKQFGRKACNGCSDQLVARVGIVLACEAGLCKNFYHVTCAQRLGLLVDLEEEELVGHLLCKKHTSSEVWKRRKSLFEKSFAHEESRMIMLRRRQLGQHEERYRQRQLDEYNRHVRPLHGVNIIAPGPNSNKRPRLIQSSAEMIEGFARKAEIALGISRDKYMAEFTRIPTENLNLGTALSFTEESVRQFEHRETVLLDELTEYAEDVKVSKEEAEVKAQEIQEELRELEESHSEATKKASTSQKLCLEFHDLLASFGGKGLSKAFQKLPRAFPPVPKPAPAKSAVVAVKKATKRHAPSPSFGKKIPKLVPQSGPLASDVITLSDDDEAPPMLEMIQPNVIHESFTHGPPARKNQNRASLPVKRRTATPTPTPEPKEKKPKKKSNVNMPGYDVPKVCKTCQKDTDPNLMPFCDLCRSHYHIYCLDPPLAKMPKVTRFYGWNCAACLNTDEGETEGDDAEMLSVKTEKSKSKSAKASETPEQLSPPILVKTEVKSEETGKQTKHSETGSSEESGKVSPLKTEVVSPPGSRKASPVKAKGVSSVEAVKKPKSEAVSPVKEVAFQGSPERRRSLRSSSITEEKPNGIHSDTVETAPNGIQTASKRSRTKSITSPAASPRKRTRLSTMESPENGAEPTLEAITQTTSCRPSTSNSIQILTPPPDLEPLD
uniref:PHD-type domain-containing protein n=1 Tax=Panagrellus redivivus TaxID=6233 RepID=A0A7E4UW49_PANRE